MSSRKKEIFPVFVIKDGKIADLIFRDVEARNTLKSPIYVADSIEKPLEKDRLSPIELHRLHPRPL
jgi:hypothetical protein